MSLVNFTILLSILQYGHCLTLTLEDFDNWKKLMKAELKEDIFLELPETEQIKRMNRKIREVMKTNEEIITIVQSHGTKLDSFQADIKNKTNQIQDLAKKIEVLDENHHEVQNMTSLMKTSLDQLKSNHGEHQTATNGHFYELENYLNGLEVNLNKSELILKNHTDQMVKLKSKDGEHLTATNYHFGELENHLNGLEVNLNESDLILKNHTDQIVQLKTSIDRLEAEQNETKGLIEDLHSTEGTHLTCNFAKYSSVPNRCACTIINFGGKNPTYMSLFGPTRLLILRIFSHIHVYSIQHDY
jgi:chromosome segregation ATPase